MFFQLHRFFRDACITELQALFDEHPYYTTLNDEKFQQGRVQVMDNYTFDGRQFPAVVVKTTSSDEVRLGMNKHIEEVYGHTRITGMVPYIIMKAEDDPEYTGTYSDAVYKLEFVNTGRENKRDIQLRTGTLSVTGDPHEVTPTTDMVYTNITYTRVLEHAWHTDIISGVKLFFSTYNAHEPGKTIYVETYQDAQHLGDLYGTGFDFEISLDVYAQSQAETEEIIDLINAFFIFLLPQRLFNAYGFVTKTAHTTNVLEKDGKLGEEVFKAAFSISAFTETHFFIPNPTITSWVLWLEMRERVDAPGGLNLIGGRV